MIKTASSSSQEFLDFSAFSLTDQELCGIYLDDRRPIDMAIFTGSQWCLLSHFLTDQSVNFQAIKQTLTTLWKPVKSVAIHDLGS